MSFDWKAVVSTVAPLIGTAIGGPFGGMAAKAASMALLGRDDATEDELSLAVQNATPEQFTVLKQSDNDFKIQMETLGIKKEALVFADKDSARKREMAIKDKTPAVLAYVLVAGFLGTLGALFKWPIPEQNAAIIYTMVGALGTLAITACAYYHGSSRSSAKKDLLLKK